MKKKILLIALLASTLTTWAQTEKYDLNDDGKVNVADITVLVDYILTLQNPGGAPGDDDSNVSSDALVGTWTKITNGGVIGIKFTADGKAYYNEWNVGEQPNFDNVKSPAQVTITATSIKITHTQIPDYFEEYSYILSDDGNSVTFTLVSWNKDNHGLGETTGYTSDNSSGHSFTHNGNFESPEDDAAHVNWGGSWYMPTVEDFKELLDNTTNEWVVLDGVRCRKFTSTVEGLTDKSIFLPAAGYFYDTTLESQGLGGYYWSASPSTKYLDTAQALDFHTLNNYGIPSIGTAWGRCRGHSVRPVLRK